MAWGGLNFHINEIFAEVGLTSGDVSVAYTVMTVAGIVTGLFVGYFVIDRLQRKSVCVAMATAW